ncbi:MAG: TraR/DksA C4-type zinc finger protein [Actinomycetota bacterium]|nr:TraR/DksA C4-type zinc finger protein [Actinomycetota bacterium]
MDEKRLEVLKERLKEEKVRLEADLKVIEEDNMKQTQSEMTGENSYEDNFADCGTATFEREKDLSLERNIRDLLSRVEESLIRLGKGVYGKCVVCGNEIDPARLKALPYVDLCLDCKKKEEKNW